MKPLLTLSQLEQEVEEIKLNLHRRAETIMDDYESYCLLKAEQVAPEMLAWIHSAIKRNKKQ